MIMYNMEIQYNGELGAKRSEEGKAIQRKKKSRTRKIIVASI